MAVMDGCESKNRTPILKEIPCPRCGETMEIYTVKSRMIEDAQCDCGYVLKAEDYNTAGQKKKAE
jgi:predicted RNA-binding Zn-ribbon protein involved in translation (DUF1610 family)